MNFRQKQDCVDGSCDVSYASPGAKETYSLKPKNERFKIIGKWLKKNIPAILFVLGFFVIVMLGFHYLGKEGQLQLAIRDMFFYATIAILFAIVSFMTVRSLSPNYKFQTATVVLCWLLIGLTFGIYSVLTPPHENAAMIMMDDALFYKSTQYAGLGRSFGTTTIFWIVGFVIIGTFNLASKKL